MPDPDSDSNPQSNPDPAAETGHAGPDLDRIDRRLRAVERAVTDADRPPADLADAAEATDRIDDIEGRLDGLASDLADLEAAVRALRGYVGSARAVDEETRRRAEEALSVARSLRDRVDHDDRNDSDDPADPADRRVADRPTSDGRDPTGEDRNRAGETPTTAADPTREDERSSSRGVPRPGVTDDAGPDPTGDSRPADGRPADPADATGEHPESAAGERRRYDDVGELDDVGSQTPSDGPDGSRDRSDSEAPTPGPNLRRPRGDDADGTDGAGSATGDPTPGGVDDPDCRSGDSCATAPSGGDPVDDWEWADSPASDPATPDRSDRSAGTRGDAPTDPPETPAEGAGASLAPDGGWGADPERTWDAGDWPVTDPAADAEPSGPAPDGRSVRGVDEEWPPEEVDLDRADPWSPTDGPTDRRRGRHGDRGDGDDPGLLERVQAVLTDGRDADARGGRDTDADRNARNHGDRDRDP